MGSNTKMTRTHARAAKGERAIDKIPYKDNKKVSVIGALTIDDLIANMSIEGSIDGSAFDNFVSRMLVPHLKCGDIVILDNYKVHLSEYAKRMIESVGASLLFLPPYSPDFSPIELYWSKVKSILRTLKARSKRALNKALKIAFDSISKVDIIGWFEHCGFKVSYK
jgi:transposase